MFPWSDSCLFERLKKQRRLSSDQTEILDLWTQEVCSGGGSDLPEVEIISLLQQQIPKYKLRADSLTEFAGYENQDWFIPSPALKIDQPLDSWPPLSADEIRETLNYFLLCSNRVSQMTKTYNDVEAVTRLLEEKEKDLELTARIGKELLDKNQKLETGLTNLECELRQANERIAQLSHEITKKSQLISILTNDVDEQYQTEQNSSWCGGGVINLDVLQHKIGKLEAENVALRSEASLLAAQTDEVEEQEQKLMTDFTSELCTLRSDLIAANDEADKCRQQNDHYKQLSEQLAEKLSVSEHKLQQCKQENVEMSTLLNITKETQNELAGELCLLKERYGEVLALLQETQLAIKRHKSAGSGLNRTVVHPYPSLYQQHLQLHPSSSNEQHHYDDELMQCSLFSELSLDSGISTNTTDDRTCSSSFDLKKVFETVRSAAAVTTSSNGNKYTSNDDEERAAETAEMRGDYERSSGGHQNSSNLSSQRNSWYGFSSSSAAVYDDWSTCSSRPSECSDRNYYPGGRPEGIPGAPGSADLAEALRRLNPAAVYARRAAAFNSSCGGQTMTTSYDFVECRTPDSIMSTGYASMSMSMPPSSSSWKLPDKLQIVKPMEGSQTLHQWSQLAKPWLGGLLDERPGIKTRGAVDLQDLGIRLYNLDDVEEDEELLSSSSLHPGKSFQSSCTVYTYTNSTVMHPDDRTASRTNSVCASIISSCSSNNSNSRISTVSNSRASSSGLQTPARRNSTCTFSVTLGLARMLNERGITAVTPSALVTPFTATPCNSPDRRSSSAIVSLTTVDAAVSSSSAFSNAFAFPSYLVSSGAEYLRKTLIGTGISDSPTQHQSSRYRTSNRHIDDDDHHHHPMTTILSSEQPDNNSKKALSTGLRLVEKVEKLGVESLISSTGGYHGSTASGGRPDGLPDGSLHARFRARNRNNNDNNPRSNNSRVRPDLGTVIGSVPAVPDNTTASAGPSLASSTLGTLSSMLFGRKGGLL